MKKGGATHGYTIVEVMMFLVVTAALLASAMALVGGSQQKAEFNQGIRDTESDVSDVINDVATGFYPNTSNYPCSATSGEVQFIGSSTGQGSHTDCILIGKVIQFTQGSDVRVYSVAGRRVVPGTIKDTEVTSLSEARPKAIDVANVTQNKNLSNGIKVKRIYVDLGTGTTTDIGGVGFFSTFGKLTGANPNDPTELEGGNQTTDVVALPGSQLSDPLTPPSNTYSHIRNLRNIDNPMTPLSPLNSYKNPKNGIVVCLTNGNKDAALQIGGGGQQTSVTLYIDSPPGNIRTECNYAS